MFFGKILEFIEMLKGTENLPQTCGSVIRAGLRVTDDEMIAVERELVGELSVGGVSYVTRDYRTAIVYGMGPCGKTFHARALGSALGCEPGVVLDLGGVGCPGSLMPGGLHFAQARPGRDDVPDDVLVVSIDAAMGAAIALGKI
jgi:hypothetical protein